MNITEKDLYKFVFYKSELPVEKQDFIKENLDRFSSSIKILNEIKTQLELEVNPKIIDKIHNLIASQSQEEEIVLTPIRFDNCTDYLVLAADSKSTESNINPQTFTDSGNRYMVKIVSEDTENRLYLFKSANMGKTNLSLTVYPSNEKYSLEGENSNSILLKKQKIEKIVIK